MDLTSARAAFFDEARDQRAALEQALLQSEATELDDESFNRMFRAVHTIKGAAGLFGLDAIVHFTHIVENVLDRLRSRQIALDRRLVSLLLAANDHIGVLLAAAERDDGAAPQYQPGEGELVQALSAYAKRSPGTACPLPVPPAPTPPSGQGGRPCWLVAARFADELFLQGMDPGCFVRFLGSLGEVRQVVPIFDRLPALIDFDPERCYFGYDVLLQADTDAATILDAFDFVRPQSRVELLPPRATLADIAAVRDRLPEPPAETVARWLALGLLSVDEARALEALGKVEVATDAPVTRAAARDEGGGAGRVSEYRVPDSRFIRVEASKLDRLINKVGELVIASASTTVLTDRRNDGELSESVAAITHLVASIRDDALALRMVPIGEVFGRFPRIVRDAADMLGKPIELVIEGADAEVDKSMVEKLTDPLMHLVRNAIDHGIEPPALREQRGKPAVGRVTLRAYHDSSSVVIEVGDDGGGLNRDKILAQAIARGLVASGANLSDADVYRLIFEPGFSTAEKVTDLSGRGVGMDVVRRNIETLRGSVEILSSAGIGNTFRIRLPLTLAIIDGFRVQVADSLLVVPVDMMYECVEMPPGAHREGARQLNLRGEWLPYISLRELFQLSDEACATEYVVVVQYGGERAGLVVDRLLGEFQAVIKPLGSLFKALKGISGSTILGNGDPALILDVPQLVQFAWQLERASVRRSSGVPRGDAGRQQDPIS